MKIKTIHVVPYIGDASNGPAYSVPNLCRCLVCSGTDVTLHTLEPVPENLEGFETIGHIHQKFPHPALGRSSQMHKAIEQACTQSDIIHNHSLWMLPNIYPEYARRGTSCKLVVSPRGTLSEWALRRSRSKKLFSWMIGQRKALLNADMLHATSIKEYKEIRRFGLKQPVAIIPNGIDIPQKPNNPQKNSPRQLLFLGRIHPVKGLENLINAWNTLEGNFRDWELVIAGPGKFSYVDKIQRLIMKLHLKRVIFKGELNSIEKQKAFLEAELFVLPSYTENFGMVVAEALSSGLPVITTKETPWQGIDKRKCGLCVDIGVTPLVEALRQIMPKPSDELMEMGDNGRKWMKEDYSWDEIGHKMKSAYSWFLGQEKKPHWVLSD